MVLLSCEDFLQELTDMVVNESETHNKSLWITYKRYIPNSRTWKRKKTEQAESQSDADPVCLIRAKIGKRKISTHVPNSISENFTNAINDICELMGHKEDDAQV